MLLIRVQYKMYGLGEVRCTELLHPISSGSLSEPKSRQVHESMPVKTK